MLVVILARPAGVEDMGLRATMEGSSVAVNGQSFSTFVFQIHVKEDFFAHEFYANASYSDRFIHLEAFNTNIVLLGYVFHGVIDDNLLWQWNINFLKHVSNIFNLSQMCIHGNVVSLS